MAEKTKDLEENSEQDTAHISREHLQAQNKLLQEELDRQEQQIQAQKNQITQLTNKLEHVQDSLKHLAPSPIENVITQRAEPSEGRINMRWRSLPNAPTGMWAGSSAVIGDRAYIRSAGSQIIHVFDSSNQQWSTLPVHPTNGFTVVNVENTVTTVGGKIRSCNKNVYIYENGEWIESLPQMPTKRWLPGAVYKHNSLVVAGGVNGDQLSTVEILNTTSRQWSSVSSLPVAMHQPSTCVHGEHIYITLSAGSDVWEYWSIMKCSLAALVKSEPSSKEWEMFASLPVRSSALSSVNGHLIAVGGLGSGGQSVYQYNHSTYSWISVSRMFAVHQHCITALLPGNQLMVVGGLNSEARRSIEIATIK